MLYIVMALWILLGGGVFLVALSGGPGGLRGKLHTESRVANRLRAFAFAIVFAFGLAVPIAVAIANGQDKGRQGPSGITLTPNEAAGRALFARTCATCHTLAAASAVGHVGPDLDLLLPNKALVLFAIKNGYAEGIGQMPAGTYSGQDAENIAEFVSAVAGH